MPTGKGVKNNKQIENIKMINILLPFRLSPLSLKKGKQTKLTAAKKLNLRKKLAKAVSLRQLTEDADRQRGKKLKINKKQNNKIEKW
jgi:hypothetical protein